MPERLLGSATSVPAHILGIVRAAHCWTTSVGTQVEDDISSFKTHEALATCILSDPEASSDKINQSLLDELPALPRKSR
jgi:hypothetical protein